nr:hypothetical protein [Hyphomonadaceae bacterium]
RDGVGFSISARSTRGLNLRGLARAMQAEDGRVYVMLFMAPDEHYYGKLSVQVEQVFDSARF